MSAKVVFLYLLVLILGAGIGVAKNYLDNGQVVLPDAVLTALLYSILGLMVLVTAHACSLWGIEAPDIDLEID